MSNIMTTIDNGHWVLHDLHVTTDTISGEFRWVPAEDNGPTMPFERSRISAFAYVGDHMNETAVFVEGLPPAGETAPVSLRWVDGYPAPDVEPGDVITLTASQRSIATIRVESTDREQ